MFMDGILFEGVKQKKATTTVQLKAIQKRRFLSTY